MGNCNQICHNNPTLPELPASDPAKTSQHPSQIQAQQFSLKCELCGQERKHTALKNHLDLCHFVSINYKNDIDLQALCLLCDFKSTNLDQFKIHLKARHQYMQEQSRKNSQEEQRNKKIQTNSGLKQRIKMIQNNQLQKSPDGRTGKIEGHQYHIVTHEKQYGALEFDEQRAIGDLVWRYIFTDQNLASFYSIQFRAQQKSILAISNIFTKTVKNL